MVSKACGFFKQWVCSIAVKVDVHILLQSFSFLLLLKSYLICRRWNRTSLLLINGRREVDTIFWISITTFVHVLFINVSLPTLHIFLFFILYKELGKSTVRKSTSLVTPTSTF